MKNYSFTINGIRYNVEIKDIDGAIARLEVNGTAYEVEIHKKDLPKKPVKTPTIVQSKVPAKDPQSLTTSTKVTKVQAPLPGTIIKVLVKPGDQVKREDKLLIMEAMKMENSVLSEKTGTVKSVLVREGDTVLQGDLLIEVE